MKHFIIYILLILTIVITDYKHRHKKEPAVALKALTITQIEFPEYFMAYATIYHPTVKECGWDKNIQASGSTGIIGTCACSQPLFDYNVNYGDTIEVCSGSLQGKYVVTDKAGSKARVIDIWRPVGDTIADCYKTKFRIIKTITKNTNYEKFTNQ
jgi:hypothetical protein